MYPDPDSDETPSADPDETVSDRIHQHDDEQQRRAAEEPKHEGPPDRTIGTDPP